MHRKLMTELPFYNM